MKNKENTYLYACTLAILLLFAGCDKGPNLTPITQEGKNTFSCKVNGKVWVPTGRGDIFVNIPAIEGGFYYDYSKKKNFGNIQVFAYGNGNQDLKIFLSDILEGEYLLNQNTSFTDFSPANYGYYSNIPNSYYLTKANNIGKVTITKADTITGIIAGTFDFTAADAKGNLVRITEGRFDIKSPL